MWMLKKFLKEMVSIVVGKQAEEIVDLLDNKKYVNEFLIAKKLNLTINQTRNILYKLSDYGLVSSVRKKDKKKGWYTYFWKIEILKSLEFLKGTLIKQTEQINYQVKSRETKRFYVCEKCNIEFSEENALLNNFTCPECGGIFTVKDNSKFLKELGKNLDKLKRELTFIDIEIKKEKERIEKEKIKEIKKEERKKMKNKKKVQVKKKSAKVVKQKKGRRKSEKKKIKKKKAVKPAKKLKKIVKRLAAKKKKAIVKNKSKIKKKKK